MAEPAAESPDLQRINIKLLADVPGEFDGDPLLAVFGRWRLEEGEEIVDLADYCHVSEGPGVLLISQRYHFGVDFAQGRPSVYYSSRKGLSGPPAERLRAVLRAAIAKTLRLLGEAEMTSGLCLRPGELEVTLNDRLVAPNSDATDALWRPAIGGVLDALFGKGRYAVARHGSQEQRLSYAVTAAAGDGLTLQALLTRL